MSSPRRFPPRQRTEPSFAQLLGVDEPSTDHRPAEHLPGTAISSYRAVYLRRSPAPAQRGPSSPEQITDSLLPTTIPSPRNRLARRQRPADPPLADDRRADPTSAQPASAAGPTRGPSLPDARTAEGTQAGGTTADEPAPGRTQAVAGPRPGVDGRVPRRLVDPDRPGPDRRVEQPNPPNLPKQPGRRRHPMVSRRWRVARGVVVVTLAVAVGALYEWAPLQLRSLPEAGCQVRHSVVKVGAAEYEIRVNVTNTGASRIQGWQLRWPVTGTDRIDQVSDVVLATRDGFEIAKDSGFNRLLQPGGTVAFTIRNGPTQPQLPTTGFTLNGIRCS